MTKRIGRQTPTKSKILPYTKTLGDKSIKLYQASKRTAYKWQKYILDAILAVNNEGLWTHVKFGLSVPRQNGKNEVVAIREFIGFNKGRKNSSYSS